MNTNVRSLADDVRDGFVQDPDYGTYGSIGMVLRWIIVQEFADGSILLSLAYPVGGQALTAVTNVDDFTSSYPTWREELKAIGE